jgi:transcriptional regulator with XRE-family HTH domain
MGQWVRAARLHKRWTQAQLARAVGVTAPNVSHWENGHHKIKHETLLRISQLTGYVLREVAPPEEWPLPRIPYQRLANCSPEQLEMLQFLMLTTLKAMEESRSWDDLMGRLRPSI